MRAKKLITTCLACILALTYVIPNSTSKVEANSKVIADIKDNQIVIGNDDLSRVYAIDSDRHVATSEVLNKKINKALRPAKGSADFYMNTLYAQEPTKGVIDRSGWTGKLLGANGAVGLDNIKNLIDGNDTTEVETAVGGKFPYYLDLNLGKKESIKTFSYQKRMGNGNAEWGINGTIGKYNLYVSDNGTDWKAAGKGEFKREDYNLHDVNNGGSIIHNVADLVYGEFDKVYETQYVRLEMLSGALSNNASMTLAELSLFEDGYTPPTAPDNSIDSNDLILKDAKAEDSETGVGKKVTIEYQPYQLNGITWNFNYITVIEPDEHFMRSYVEASCDKEAQAQIDYIELDHFVLDDMVTDVWTHPQFGSSNPGAWGFPGFEFMLGQPIYADGMFFGSEFPATDTQVVKDTMQIRYFSGKTMKQLRDEERLTTDGKFVTWPNVVGAAAGTNRDVVQTDFYAYIDTIATQTSFRKQYNSWYDNRMAITDESISKAFFATEKGLTANGVEPIDAYVVDDGWNNYNDPDFTGIDEGRSGKTYNRTGFWEFNDKFPDELYPAKEMASKFASSFGLWLGPQGGYELYNTFSKYLQASGTSFVNKDAGLGEVVCTGSKKYIKNLTKLFVDYQSRFDIDYWKLDGFSSRPCKSANHDHMTGGYQNMYYTSEHWENWSDAFEVMREQRASVGKGLFINATCYVNASPWLLRWVNAIWMQNSGDLATGGTGSTSAKMITGRDIIYFNNYKSAQVQLPLKNVYNHDPIYGVSAGVSMDATGFRDYMMANAVRGTAFWELYFSPSMMDEAKWQITADVLEWAEENAHILEKAKLFGTSATNDIYGYSSWDKDEGIISFRNPTSTQKTYTLKLDNVIGVPTDMKDLSIMQILPYKNTIDGETVSYDSLVTLTLAPYETRIYQYGKKDDAKPSVTSIKNTNEKTIRIKFNERVSDDMKVTIDGKDVESITLMEDYKTVEVKSADVLSNTIDIEIDAKDIKGNTYKETKSLQIYKDAIIAKAMNKEDIEKGESINEEIQEGTNVNFMSIDKHSYQLKNSLSVSGVNDFSASFNVKTKDKNVDLLKQDGAFSISIDEEGFIKASVGSKTVTSKETLTRVVEKATGNFASDEYVPTSTKDILNGKVNDNKIHNIGLVREVNGMLKLYVDGALCNTVYDKKSTNENLKAASITLGDAKVHAKIADVQVVNYAKGYDDLKKEFDKFNLERYQAMDRSEWTASASSTYQGSSEGPAKFAIDGNTNTLWHTDYAHAYPDPLDHWISIDFKKPTTFSRFAYTARAKGINGNMKGFTLQIKNENGEWEDYTSGEFNDGGTTYIDFDEVTTTAIRLKVVGPTYGGQTNHASAVEINVYKDNGELPDLNALQSYIENMGDLKAIGDYSTTSYKTYEQAYNDVILLLDSLNLTIAKIATTKEAYENSVSNLVNVVELKNVLMKAEELIKNEAAYTEAYVTALKGMIQDAKSLLVESIVQSDVDALIASLSNLVDHPLYREDTTISKGILANAISKSKAAIDAGSLDTLAPIIQTLFMRYYNIANTVYANKEATNAEVLDAWLNLADIMQYLDFEADKTALNTLIIECDAINPEEYTIGVEEFKTALANAKKVAKDDNALQARIDLAYGTLLAAKDGLDKQDVNKTILKYFIDLANEVTANAANYKQDVNWAAMIKALEEAEAVFANDKTTQSEVNEAVMKLSDAYMSIRLLPNEQMLEELNKFIVIAKGVNKALYKEKDYEQIQSVMVDSEKMYNEKDFTEAEYLVILDRINGAYKLIDEGKITKSDNSSVPGVIPNDKDNGVNTGDTTNIALLILIAGLAGMIGILARRRCGKV